MTDQAQSEAHAKADALKKKLAEATEKMTNHAIAERVRAAHPNAGNSDEGIDAMVKDYERVVAESKQPYGTAKPASVEPGHGGHGGDPGHQGQGQGQETAPGQNKPSPR